MEINRDTQHANVLLDCVVRFIGLIEDGDVSERAMVAARDEIGCLNVGGSAAEGVRDACYYRLEAAIRGLRHRRNGGIPERQLEENG